MTHATCVAQHSCNIVIWWPYLTWLWPLLSIMSILLCYLLHHLGSLLAIIGFAAVVSPILEASKAKSGDFDLWPDINLTCDLLKIKNKKYSLRAFDWRLAHLITTAGSRVSRRGIIFTPPPPPATARRVRPETPALCGLMSSHSRTQPALPSNFSWLRRSLPPTADHPSKRIK